MAQAVESNAGLGHAWQKIVRLLTVGRGIDAKPRHWRKAAALTQSRAPDESLGWVFVKLHALRYKKAPKAILKYIRCKLHHSRR